MRTRMAMVAFATIAALVAADVWAQPGGRRGGRGFGGFGRGGFGVSRINLLRVDKVQEDLKLTPDQEEQLTAAREELREQGRRGFGNFRDMSREERQEWRTERLNQEMAAIDKVLDDAQAARLNEIYLQVQGARALTDPKVAEKLNISAAQTDELETVQRDAGRDMRDQFADFRDMSPEERRATMEELQKKTNEQLLAVLSDSQKEAFAQMKGEPLELTQEDLSQARPRFGGRGRRGDG